MTASGLLRIAFVAAASTVPAMLLARVAAWGDVDDARRTGVEFALLRRPMSLAGHLPAAIGPALDARPPSYGGLRFAGHLPLYPPGLRMLRGRVR